MISIVYSHFIVGCFGSLAVVFAGYEGSHFCFRCHRYPGQSFCGATYVTSPENVHVIVQIAALLTLEPHV